MEYILLRIRKARGFGFLYTITLFHAFHFFATHYIDSSFLELSLSSKTVGFLIALSSLLTFFALAYISKLLHTFGAYKIALIATLIDFATSLGLAYITYPFGIYVCYVIQGVSIVMTLFCLDIFLEQITEKSNDVGFYRGLFLTISTLASLFAPVISGFLIGDTLRYDLAYIIGAVYLIPVLIFLLFAFKDFKDPSYEIFSFNAMYKTLMKNKNILNISFAQFLLRFYFSWMVVYLPIYLHKYINFSWSEIGILLFIMILPYIFIEFPAGLLADRLLGEKELLFTGFFVTSISTYTLFFIQTNNFLLWAIALFTTRIGAALIESMSETYFFKQIHTSEVSTLSIFRMLRPCAYFLGPILASASLFLIPIQYLWIILAIIMSFGTFTTFFLEDTQ